MSAAERVAKVADLRERLAIPEAWLYRTDLDLLGLNRRAVDAIFRVCPNTLLPGYARPVIRVADYLALIAERTYDDDRVYPRRGSVR